MTKVKICGITNYRDAIFSAKAGADLLGFIFYKQSKRYISPEKAKSIIAKLPKDILKVGVFVDEEQARVEETAGICGLDILQFHGGEDPDYLASFKGYQTIKAFRVGGALSLKGIMACNADFFLFDAYLRDAFGGTGKVFDWDILQPLRRAAQAGKIKTPFFVSGGLTPDNVGELMKRIGPFAVDVSSGVEVSPGKKDHRLVKEFINEVKRGAKRR